MADLDDSHPNQVGVFVSWDERKAAARNARCPFYELVPISTIDLVTHCMSKWTALPLTSCIDFDLQYKTVDDRHWPQIQTDAPENKTLSLLAMDVKGVVDGMWLSNGYFHVVFARCDGEDLSIKDLKAVEAFFRDLTRKDDTQGGLPRLNVEMPKPGLVSYTPDGKIYIPMPPSKLDPKVRKAAYDKAFTKFDP